MRTLVVGGNRFVGLEIVNRLLVDGHDVDVLALDRLPDEIASHCRWLHANRNHADELARALADTRYDVVVDNIAYERPQVEGLLAALGGRVGRYVLTSSVDVYGLHAPRGFAEEDAPLEPSALEGTTGHERYQRGKRGCELALRASGVAWTVVRPGLVTGRRDNITPPPFLRHLAFGEEASRSQFFPARVLDGGPIVLRTDDHAVFRLAWAQDVARAIAFLMGDSRAVGAAYNVAGDELWTSEQLVRAMCEAAGRDARIARATPYELHRAGLGDHDPAWGRGPFWSVAPTTKLRALGWRPTPAAQWLAKLVEAAPEAKQAPSYERRLAEIALARRIEARESAALPRPLAPPQELEREQAPTTSVHGRLRADESATYRARVEAGPTPPNPAFFRTFLDATISGIGVGTWMGDTSAATDALYLDALAHAAKGGVNVFDTAINYRNMKAERVVGAAVRRLEGEGFTRSMFSVSSKCGFITHDADDPRAPERYVEDEYVRTGLVSRDEAKRGHSIGAKFVRAQLEKSASNLGLQAIDLYYLHNPEVAREAVGGPAFDRLLGEAFEVLEQAATDGLIASYGLATWFALTEDERDPRHIDLAGAVALARTAAGSDSHHFKAIQLPYNLAKTEPYTRSTQFVYERRRPVLEAAQELGLYVFTSASVLQGKLDDPAVEARFARVPGAPSRAAAALQFARSTPGVGTALVGMRRQAHVEEALAVSRLEPLTGASLDNICD